MIALDENAETTKQVEAAPPVSKSKGQLIEEESDAEYLPHNESKKKRKSAGKTPKRQANTALGTTRVIKRKKANK